MVIDLCNQIYTYFCLFNSFPQYHFKTINPYPTYLHFLSSPTIARSAPLHYLILLWTKTMRRQSERCKNILLGLGSSSISIRGPPFLPCTRHLPHCAHSAYRSPCYSEAFICEKRLLSHGGSIFYNPTHTVYILSCPYRIVNSNDLLFRLICAVRPVEVSAFHPFSLSRVLLLSWRREI